MSDASVPLSTSSRAASGRTGFPFLSLFALTFVGAGLLSGLHFLRTGVDGMPVPLLVSALFAAVGVGLLWLAAAGRRTAIRQAELQARHPEQPWMWRPDWAEGRVQHRAGRSVAFAWALAIFWNALSTPALFFLPGEVLDKGNRLALIGLVFPLVGVGLLVLAARATIRWRKFGQSILELDHIPIPLGGMLQGRLQTGLPGGCAEEVRLSLSCVRRVTTGSRRHRSTTETILWRDGGSVRSGRLAPGPTGLAVPVRVAVPADQPSTDASDPSSQIRWVLRADAAVRGVDYSVALEVPVFDSAEVRPARATPHPAPEEIARRPEPSRGIRVGPGRDGRLEFYFGPARHPLVAAGSTGFLGIWIGAIALQVELGAPLVFPILFGLVGALIAISTLELWGGASRAIVHAHGLEVRTMLLGIGRRRFVPFDVIRDVRTRIGMQVRYGSRGIPYHDLAMRTKDGREVFVAHGIRDRREAEWLAAEMTRVCAPPQA